jgi:hypothetical protein|tara:strand:- start:1022 stop:1189 length:168 start_codon:yes stop_codon:yes gene_type:complete
MYHVLLSERELKYLQALIDKKLDTYFGYETKILKNIKKQLDDPETADDYYDGVDY